MVHTSKNLQEEENKGKAKMKTTVATEMMTTRLATTVANNTTHQVMTSMMKSGFVVQDVLSGHTNHVPKQMESSVMLEMVFCVNHVVTKVGTYRTCIHTRVCLHVCRVYILFDSTTA